MKSLSAILWVKRLSLGLLIFSYLSVSFADTDDESVAFGLKIGGYISETKGKQQLLYRILDYCAAEFPADKEVILNGKVEWGKRNLSKVNSWQSVIRDVLKSKGLTSEEIASQMRDIEAAATAALDATKSNQDVVIKSIADKPPKERMYTCGVFSGVIGQGLFDVRPMVLSDSKK